MHDNLPSIKNHIMKKIFFLSVLLCIIGMAFTSCSDDDNDSNSSSNLVSMAEAKAQVATSEAEFSSQFNLSDFTKGFDLVKYFNTTYGGYSRETDNSVIPFANFLSVIKSMAAGRISELPSSEYDYAGGRNV